MPIKKKIVDGSGVGEIIQLSGIKFDQPAFRRLGSIDIEIASRITLIAGRNGVGKSTILALIAAGSGITRRGTKNTTYFGNLPNANIEDILKLSFTRDFVSDEFEKPHVLLKYNFGGKEFFKKGNVSGSENRLRIVPRNEPKGPLSINGLAIPPDGKVPIPTIYLGMTRVLPVGEAYPESLERKSIKMDPEDYQVYSEFTNRIISTGSSDLDQSVISQSVKGTKKRSVYPNYNGYDSMSVSLGQDSLSAIATALASFSKLKRVLGTAYKGGLLIIDELDAGFHPHAQIELFEELKSKARRLQIQVVATTHSLTLLERAHGDIYDTKKRGRPLDQIIYLKGGRPIELLDASEFQAIYSDMHMLLRQPSSVPAIKVYLEDEEAALFLNAILTPQRKAALKANTGCKIDVVPVKVGCSNLVGLLKADDYFKSVVIVLDGDTTNVNAGRASNVVRLPIDPLNLHKQSPEVIVKAMCEKMCSDDVSYPATRTKLKLLGGDTSYVEREILSLQRGESSTKNKVETDREVAKNWFNTRLPSIKSMKLIEGWVADNVAEVEPFMAQLEQAILAVKGMQFSPAVKTPMTVGKNG